MSVGLNKGHKMTKNVSKPRHNQCLRCLPSTPSLYSTRSGSWVALPIRVVTYSCSRSPSTKEPSSSLRKGEGCIYAPKRKLQELSNKLATMRNIDAKKD
ncbi:60S ribosomal protein L36-like [Octodon degus]|uniref:60S ribosomal protein L36-like n=1 Tax=Octodon degus TaxID=10160 RepID=A0A6P3FZH2_OCTDE|nr:60S ribosomal protein L36-like [Octodon degus]